jgi:hypothetical protein
MLTDCCRLLSATPNGFVGDTNGVTLAKKQGTDELGLKQGPSHPDLHQTPTNGHPPTEGI